MAPNRMAGCAFGKVSREKIENIKAGFEKVEKKIDGLDTKVTQLFNHQSNRLPTWATIALSFLTMLVGALLGVIGRGIFNG